MNSISKESIEELLKIKDDHILYHRENKNLEFKEQFNLAGAVDYFRDFAGFANNNGGYMIFGVKNSPRELSGLSDVSVKQFEKIDEAELSGKILGLFSPNIDWQRAVLDIRGKKVGVFYIEESQHKPVIARKDDQSIKNGDIYYRYAGRTQRITYAELSYIIEQRVKKTNDEWISLMKKVANIGPANAAILDTERGIIQKNKNQTLLIDEKIIPKIKFIREGYFQENQGATTLRLIGDVQSVNSLEVVKTVHRRLTDQYPLSCKELVASVRKSLPEVGMNAIYEIIRENRIKEDRQYSDYNFRTKSQEERYRDSGQLPKGVVSIYNQNAVEFIVKALEKR